MAQISDDAVIDPATEEDTQQDIPPEETRSVRQLTEKGQAYFNEKYTERKEIISSVWRQLEGKLDSVKTLDNVKDLQSVKDCIENIYRKHVELCEDLVQFCERYKTVESLQAANTQQMMNHGCRILVETALRQADTRIRDLSREQASVCSKRSKHSKHSRSGSGSSYRSDYSTGLQLKAKAEAAKARLKFAEKEAEIKRQQAILDQQQALDAAKVQKEKADVCVDLELLTQKREVAAAEAEAQAFDSGDERSDIDDMLKKLDNDDSASRTNDYIEQLHCDSHGDEKLPDPNNNVKSKQSCLNPKAEEFKPRDNTASDFTRYLLKKDLLLSRLSAFDDKPENYMVWKISFKAVMQELGTTAMEELDFLLKWTGPESKRHILSIKSANASDPAKGLYRAWSRLEERYGCPEMIESSLKRRIETFPKLGAKDSSKLYELSDLLSEIEAIKCDSRMTSLLGHYDSSTGVTPIVNKLPHYLQEKWTTSAVKYMYDHNVSYPPFSHYAQFLRDQSRIRNNPSFAYDAPVVKNESYGPKRFEKNFGESEQN